MTSWTGSGGGVGRGVSSRFLCDFLGREDVLGRERFRAFLAFSDDFLGGRGAGGGGGGTRWTQTRLSTPHQPGRYRREDVQLTVEEEIGVACLVPSNRLNALGRSASRAFMRLQ
jgi:hypothetical protein